MIKRINVKKIEMYRQDFQEWHKKAVVDDIRSLSDTINNNFHNEKVTVWHCCTSNGYGYYTVSNGEKKLFVHSEYRLECVGGCWSLHVYERLYMGQVNLMKFLESVKAEICSKFSAEMPLKNLYIDYILTDLDEWENRLKDGYYREEDRHDFEIARRYQKEFTEQYPEQIEIYNDTLSKGGNFWDYYNGADNYEYSCVSNILENAVSEIYKNRVQLEACEPWCMFYDRLKNICKEKGVKVTPLVLECGGTKGMLSGWKKGASPSIEIVAKIAIRLNISTDLLILGNDSEHAETSYLSSKYINNATYNGSVNLMSGDYAHRENTIEIGKSDSSDVNVSDAALEYDKILSFLNDNDREMLISQVRTIAGTFKKMNFANTEIK